MLFRNANIFVKEGCFRHGAFRVTDGRFSEVLCPDTGEQGVDLEGQYVIPGLIDVHSHGNSGADFSDGACDGVERMARYLARNGADNSTGYTRLLRDLTLAMQEDLTPRQRELTKLYYLEGMPMTQIAQRLDVSVSTVSRTLARARRRLYHCMRFGAEDLLRR